MTNRTAERFMRFTRNRKNAKFVTVTNVPAVPDRFQSRHTRPRDPPHPAGDFAAALEAGRVSGHEVGRVRLSASEICCLVIPMRYDSMDSTGLARRFGR